MRLRLRCSKGTFPLGSSVEPSFPLENLQLEIESLSQIPIAHQQLKVGFPPRALDMSALRVATILESGIKDGDQITVESEVKVTAAQAAATGFSSADFVEVEGGGYVTARIMKNDNSCMFHAIAYLLDKDEDNHVKYRELAARYVLEHSSEYNEAVLGRPPTEYANWIMKSNSWGGAIELAIFAQYFGVNIHSIDVTSVRVDSFGANSGYKDHIILFYSGIHYDAIVFNLFQAKEKRYDKTKFAENDAARMVQGATTLAQNWHRLHKYTDLANFKLKCGVCGKGFSGETEAQAHATKTGHVEFSEF